MVAAGPCQVVGQVLHGRDAVQRSQEAARREDEAEGNLVVGGVTLLAERFARNAVAQVVYESIVDGPRVTSDEAPRMLPEIRRRRVRKLRDTAREIVNDVRSQKHNL